MPPVEINPEGQFAGGRCAGDVAMGGGFLQQVVATILGIGIVDVLDMLVVGYVVYRGLLLLQGTRSVSVVRGMLVVLVVLSLTSWLPTLNWMLRQLVLPGVIALVVIFQPELRRALVRLGQSPLFGLFSRSHKELTEQLIDAVSTLSREKIGALIAIEREVGLRSYAEGGVRLDAEVSASLLVTLFYPNTPLHDGAVILQGDRVVAAGCLFPLTENVDVGSGLGTRHRAAIGVTEDSDSLAIVVSEETGNISIAVKGQMTRDLDPEGLRMILRSLYTPTPA